MSSLPTTLPGLLSAVQTANSGSFSAAAKVLNLTPAAVSKNVATLEALLKVRLFNRTTRRLSLTEEGAAFIAQTRIGLAALNAATRQATQGLAPRGQVRINCSVGFGRRYVLPALPGFFAQYPEIQIDLVLNDQAVDLVGDGFDFGIRGGSQPPDGMVARKICENPAVLVATPTYLAMRGTPKVPSDLANHDLIRVKFLNGRMYPWVFKSKSKPTAQGISNVIGFDAKAKLLISDPEIILDAALLHVGIARMGRHHAHAALQRGDLVEVLVDQLVPADATMAIFYPHHVGLAPRVRVLIDYLMAWFAQQESLQAPQQPSRKPTPPRRR